MEPIQNRKQYVEKIVAISGCTKTDAMNAYNRFMAVLITEIEKGNNVSLLRFGNFEIQDISAGTGRNPRTGETIAFPAKKRVRFKPVPSLRKNVKNLG